MSDGNNTKQQSDRKRKYDTDEKQHASNKSTQSHSNNNNPPKESSASSDSSPPWLYHDIIVRIVTKSLANGKYFKQKAIVEEVHDDGYTADVTIMDNDDN
jgi:hypothetical protein